MVAGKTEVENELGICGELKRDWSKNGEHMEGDQLISYNSNLNLSYGGCSIFVV